MITYSGRNVWPKNTSEPGVPNDIGPSIEDIAVGLGRQSRFAGQTRAFYTVLCHSLVSASVARAIYPSELWLPRYMLFHDAHESVISDGPTTWKNPMTRCDEADLDARIIKEFGLENLDEAQRAIFKPIDLACMAAEAHALGHAEADKWWPKDKFGTLEALAFSLTVGRMQAGDPVRFLEPLNAINALKRALA